MFRKNRRLALAFLIVSSSFAKASVIYVFQGVGLPSEPVAFQLTASSFLNPPLDGSSVDVVCDQLDSSTNCNSTLIASIHFANTTISPAGYESDLRFDASDGTEYDFYFATGAFGAIGAYTTDNSESNPGTLTVTLPEPSTMMMVGCAAVLLCFIARRKKNGSAFSSALH